MLDETMKREYRALVPPKELKARVLSACRAAKKKRNAARRRMSALAACLLVVVGLSVYGLSPAPALSSEGKGLQNGTLAVTPYTIMLNDGKADRSVPFGVMPTTLQESVDNCILLTVERAAKVEVSCGTLYTYDAASNVTTDVGTVWQAQQGEQLYWHVDVTADDPKITLRTALHSKTFYLKIDDEEGWSLHT